jgi:RNA-directed DNA polymerase
MKHVVSSKIFSYLNHYLFIRQVRYVKRTHPNKYKKWTKNKYWGNLNLQRPNNNWVFGDKQIGSYMLQFSWFKIERHTLVHKKSSPDDPSLKEYWEKRWNKENKSNAQKLSKKKEKIANKQNYKCPVCRQLLFHNEPLHLHHIVPRCKGEKDTINNLVWLHQFCHHKVHYQRENRD